MLCVCLQVGHAASVLLFTYCQQSQRCASTSKICHICNQTRRRNVWQERACWNSVLKKIQINTNPVDRTKLRWGSSVQWAHLPTQGVMECSAVGLSFMCSANKCVQLLPVSLRLNPGQSLLTANIFLKYCWPTTNMTCDIWSASAQPALTSLPGALSPLT